MSIAKSERITKKAISIKNIAIINFLYCYFYVRIIKTKNLKGSYTVY